MTERKGIERKIAQAMVDRINASSVLSGICTAEQVSDPKKRLETLPVGSMLVDVIGRGSRRSKINRGTWEVNYIVAVAIHGRLRDAQVTSEALDEASWICEQVTSFIHDEADDLTVEGYDDPAQLTGSEPFPLSREALFGHGLFLHTMQFEWQFLI